MSRGVCPTFHFPPLCKLACTADRTAGKYYLRNIGFILKIFQAMCSIFQINLVSVNNHSNYSSDHRKLQHHSWIPIQWPKNTCDKSKDGWLEASFVCDMQSTFTNFQKCSLSSWNAQFSWIRRRSHSLGSCLHQQFLVDIEENHAGNLAPEHHFSGDYGKEHFIHELYDTGHIGSPTVFTSQSGEDQGKHLEYETDAFV